MNETQRKIAIKGNRTISIEWLRFIFAMVVVLVHYEEMYVGHYVAFSLGYVVVEFFFIVSGFLTMRHVCVKEPVQKIESPALYGDSLFYAYKKAKSFYIPYLIAFFMVFFLSLITAENMTFGKAVGLLFHYKWELLLLHMGGFNPNPQFGMDYLVSSAWYLSALVITTIPVYFLAKYFRNRYISFIAPISIMVIYAYCIQVYGSINVGNEVVGGCLMSGILRAFAGMSMGCICYIVAEKLKKLEWSKRMHYVAGTLEVGTLISMGCLVAFAKHISAADMLFWIFIFGILVTICFLQKTPVCKYFDTHFTKAGAYFGKLSLYIYICHCFFVNIMTNYIHGLGYICGAFVLCGSTIAFSALLMKIHIRE